MAQSSTTQHVDLFAAFANSEWSDGVGLGAWLEAHRLIVGDVPVRRLARELKAFDRLRSLVRGVADRLTHGHEPSPAAVAELNRLMRRSPRVTALHREGRRPALLSLPIGAPFDQARADIAISLASYLADGNPDRLRRCASDSCSWVFVDRSPGGRRRWCDMSVCGNRAKVRRHRARATPAQPA